MNATVVVYGLSAFLITWGLFSIFQGVRFLREKRHTQNKPISKIRAVAMGDAELAGEVKAENLIRAPFSGRECVYYTYKVELAHGQDLGWKQMGSGGERCLFYIEDGTGKILVDPEGAIFFGPETFRSKVSEAEVPGLSSGNAHINLKTIFSGIFIQGGQLPFVTEYALYPGQFICVEGYVSKIRRSINGVEHEEEVIGRRGSGHLTLSIFSHDLLRTHLNLGALIQIPLGLMLLSGGLAYLVMSIDRYRELFGTFWR